MSRFQDQIIMNKIRMESGNKPKKDQEISNNHREYYKKSTKSNIFDDTPQIRERGTSQDDKAIQGRYKRILDDFVPKYKEQTAYDRKLQELNPTCNQFKAEKSIVHKRTVSAIETRAIDKVSANPRDKKIMEQYPNMTKEELENFKSKNNENISRNTDLNKKNSTTAKTTMISSLYSNIFNDPGKNEDNYVKNSKMETKEKKKDDYESLRNKKQNPKVKLPSTMDWKFTNTQLAYKEHLQNENIPSPNKIKIIHNQVSNTEGNKDSENLYGNLDLKHQQDKDNNYNNQLKDISKILQEKMGLSASNPKVKKAIEGVSKFYQENFYSSYRVDKLDRISENYEIQNIPNYEDFNLGKVKSMFNSSGYK